MRFRQIHFLGLCYLPVFAALAANTAGARSPFYARDFLLTLQFQQGHDVVLESPGFPMALTPGGTYVAATFQTSGFDFGGFLRKYDSAGKELWTRQIPASGTAFVSAMAADASAVYLVGAVGFGRAEMFVRKYDGGGNELWSRQIRITDSYHSTAGIAIDASGIYVAVLAADQGLVRKYSPAGDELWNRPLPFRIRSMRGLSVGDGVYAAGVNESGGFLARFTTAGDVVWVTQLNSSEAETVVPAAVAADNTGLYLGGTVFRRANPGDVTFIPSTGEAFLRKLDANGTEVWARRFATSIPNSIYSLALDQGAIYTAGGTAGTLPGQCKAGGADVFVRRYDPTGAEQWTRQFGTSVYDMPGNLAVDASGIYLSGAVRGNEQTGAFIVKLPKTQSLPAGTKPAVSFECVVNAASYAGGGVVPGEIVTIFGKAMGPKTSVTYRLGADGRLLTDLDSTRVLFNGVAAPLLYASADHINAIVPNSVAGSPTVSVEVEYQGARSDALTSPVALARPGIFTIDGSGTGRGAVINQDLTVNSPENPAVRGSIVAVYVTGGGLTDPALADGSILSGAPPLVKQPLEISFDDPREDGSVSPAEVLFAGAAPGSVAGLLQINVRVPDWVNAGDSVPIYLRAGNQYAETGVTLAVR